MSSSGKNELLYSRGVTFNDLPNWQKRGVGLYWETYEKSGTTPVTGQSIVARRRRIRRDFDLPMKDEYGRFLLHLLGEGEAATRIERTRHPFSLPPHFLPLRRATACPAATRFTCG